MKTKEQAAQDDAWIKLWLECAKEEMLQEEAAAGVLPGLIDFNKIESGVFKYGEKIILQLGIAALTTAAYPAVALGKALPSFERLVYKSMARMGSSFSAVIDPSNDKQTVIFSSRLKGNAERTAACWLVDHENTKNLKAGDSKENLKVGLRSIVAHELGHGVCKKLFKEDESARIELLKALVKEDAGKQKEYDAEIEKISRGLLKTLSLKMGPTTATVLAFAAIGGTIGVMGQAGCLGIAMFQSRSRGSTLAIANFQEAFADSWAIGASFLGRKAFDEKALSEARERLNGFKVLRSRIDSNATHETKEVLLEVEKSLLSFYENPPTGKQLANFCLKIATDGVAKKLSRKAQSAKAKP